jgi:hypothetical protein
MILRRIFPFCLVAGALSIASFAQTQDSTPEQDNSGASSTVEAYVYIDIDRDTYAYDASSTGELTPIAGSPYPTNGTPMGGISGKFFVASDGLTVYSYEVLSNGAIGAEVSHIVPPAFAADAGCSYFVTAKLDRTGPYAFIIYAGLANSRPCSSDVQTFEVSKTGQLTYKGATTTAGFLETVPVVTGDHKFAYSFNETASGCCTLAGFSRESTGVLNTIGIETTLPKAEPGSDGHYTLEGSLTPDSTDHLVIPLVGPYGQIQLGSFTVDRQGDVKTTNTWDNMPALPENDHVYGMDLDPTGKILAVAHGTGVQLYHFSGAKPMTPFTKLVGSSGVISYMAWDDHGHLYALNSSGKMHVYKVTSKGMTETSGSKTVVPVGPFVVRSK